MATIFKIFKTLPKPDDKRSIYGDGGTLPVETITIEASTTSTIPSHTHVKTDITDFSHTHVKADITDFSHTHIPSEVGLGNVTNDAQLKRAANDFTTFTQKATPADNDVVLIEDSAASYAKKKTLWSNIKSTLKSYFDTLYAAVSHTHSKSQITDFAHTHGNITNDGKIGSTSGLIVTTGTGGTLQATNPDSLWVKYSSLSGRLEYETLQQQWGDYDRVLPVFNSGEAYITTENQVPTRVDLAYVANTALSVNSLSDATLSNDFNAVSKSGLYYNNSTSAVGIPSSETNLLLFHVQISANEARQYCYRSGADTLYIRRKTGGTWQSWQYLALGSHTHSNYTPYASNSQTVPASTGKWIRIATSAVGVHICEGLFEVQYTVSEYHGRVGFRVSSHYNNTDSVRIVKVYGAHFSTYAPGIQAVRVVFRPDIDVNQYAYVEVYAKNLHANLAMSVYTRMVDGIGWSLTTGDGSIPTYYVAKDLVLTVAAPNYSTSDKRTLLNPTSGVLNVDLRYEHANMITNISQNTTINISNLPDGYMGSIVLYLNGTYTLTIGTVTNEAGNTYTKYLIGTLSSLTSGYYLLTYRSVPGDGGALRCFLSISQKFTAI